MKYQVSIHDGIYQYLHETAAWYSERAQSIEVGARWQDGFLTVLHSLSVNPQRHARAKESDQFPYELRELSYGSGRRKTHRAYFRIVGQQVEVLAIRHVAQRDVTPDDL